MCQMCDFKRDVTLVQSALGILSTVDYENYYAVNKLVTDMVYSIESNEEDEEMLALQETPEECDLPIVVAFRDFHKIVEMLEDTLDYVLERSDDLEALIHQGLDSVGSDDEDPLGHPPDAFASWFDEGDDDEQI